MSRRSKANVGGAAAAGGFNFQHSLAAWAASSVLAETAASPRWELAPNVYFKAIRCETEHFVDDLLIETSDDGVVLLQITTNVTRSPKADSKLGTSLRQCVNQFLGGNARRGKSPLDSARSWDSTHDRFVIATDEDAPAWIRSELPTLLARFRQEARFSTLLNAATTAADREMALLVDQHIAQAWLESQGEEPSNRDLRTFLEMLRFDLFELRPDARDRLFAMNLLRQSVLMAPAAAEAAFHLLTQHCAELASSQGGATRADLSRFLERQPTPIRVRGPRSFGDDVAKLKSISQQFLQQLSDLSTIQTPQGGGTIKIERTPVSVLKEGARHLRAGCLVIGEPGAGKSGVIYDFVNSLLSEGADVIYLAADRIAATTEHELAHEWRLDHLPTEVIKHWPGGEPAFVVVDALDAARSEASAKFLRDLIARIIGLKSRWIVVASIRKYDLRYGQALQDLFSGEPVADSSSDSEFAKVRHLNVKVLDDAELNQVSDQSSPLGSLLILARQSADGALLTLLRNPFNLRIAASLLAMGDVIDDLSAIRSQIELLDRYWQERVISTDAASHSREMLCKSLCERMAAAGSLKAFANEIPATESTALHQLKQSGVLVEWQAHVEAKPDRNVVAYAHNILFDYACSRTLLRGSSRSVIELVTANKRLVLSLQPSFVLNFQYLWHKDHARTNFWDAVFDLLTPEVPGIGQLIGPTVCADNATTEHDLNGLKSALTSQDSPRRVAAERATQYLIGALLASKAHVELVGQNSGPWCSWLRDVSRHLTPGIVNAVRVLTFVLSEVCSSMTKEQIACVNEIACHLFDYAGKDAGLRRQLFPTVVTALCRTIEANIDATGQRIRVLIGSESIESGELAGLNFLSFELEKFFAVAPRLAAEVYTAIFTSDDPPDAKVPLGDSQLVGLTSTTGQDFRSVKHHLGEKFQAFVEAAPAIAVEVLCIVTEAYILSERSYVRTVDARALVVGDRQAIFISDYSYSWDETDLHNYDAPVKMLKIFDQHLESLVASNDGENRFAEILDLLLTHNRYAVLWRHLLKFGVGHPQPFGRMLVPIASADVVLLSSDTRFQAGELLAAVFPTLNVEDRQPIEETIVALPASVAARRQEEGERARDQILGCLPRDTLLTTVAQQRWEELSATNAFPAHRPEVGPSFTWSDVTEEDRLDDLEGRGIPARAPANVNLRSLWRPIEDFSSQYLNSVPDSTVVSTIWDHAIRLSDAIADADAVGVHSTIRNDAIGHLAQFCACIARSDDVLGNTSKASFVKRHLVFASTNEVPAFSEESDRHYHDWQSWGVPSARIHAADGLMILSCRKELHDTEVVETIRRLSRDRVKPVRNMIARRLTRLLKPDPELFWKLVEYFAVSETCDPILEDLVDNVLIRLPIEYLDRAVSLTEQVFSRLQPSQADAEARQSCVYFFLHKHVNDNHPRSGVVLDGIISDPITNYGEMVRLVGSLKEPLGFGLSAPMSDLEHAKNGRAWQVADRITSAVVKAWVETCAAVRELDQTSEKSSQEQTRNLHAALYRLLDYISVDIYFASGAHDEEDAKRKGESFAYSLEGRKRFLNDSEPVVRLLLTTGLVPVAHNLLKFLSAYVEVAPEQVFLLIGDIVIAAEREGYQHESLGADLIVKIVERYLAEYRHVLRGSDRCQELLIRVLDIFVGWPQARKLVYRLGDIYR